MQFSEAINFAKQHTRIVRTRKNLLYTFGATRLPYVCLSASENGVMIREGEVTADKPKIVLPGRDFSFDGFDVDDLPDGGALPVLIARGIEMPSANYTNKEYSVREEKGELDDLVAREVERLDTADDIRSGVIIAPERFWRLSVLLYVSSQVVRSAGANISEHIERIRLNQS